MCTTDLPPDLREYRPSSADNISGLYDITMCHRCAFGSQLESRYTCRFDFGASDACLGVGDTLFKTHRYILEKFSLIKTHIEGTTKACSGEPLVMHTNRDNHKPDDFLSAFKIVYASVIEGPYDFSAQELISALRIASAYGNPQLKTFCIERLSDTHLLPMQRIQFARECDIKTWEALALSELVIRQNAISHEEALILGIETFVVIATRREQEQYSRGTKEIITTYKIIGVDEDTTFIERSWSDLWKYMCAGVLLLLLLLALIAI